MMVSTWVGIVPQSHLRFGVLFSLVIVYLASLLSDTSAHLASSSPPWIIYLGTSSHMTKTFSLLSSYHPTPSHPPITTADGCPYPVQGCDTTHVTNSLSLHQILYLPDIPALPDIPTPNYHVTLTLAKYDVLHCFGSIEASSLASLASLLAPST